MAASATKADIISRHLANDLLQSAVLMPMRRDAGDLSVEQPTAPPADSMIQSAVTALNQGQTHYVDVPGIMPLREKLAASLLAHERGVYLASQVLITSGIQESRFLAIQMIGKMLDGIALPAVVHPGARLAAGVRSLPVHTLPVDPDSLLPTLDGLAAALNSGVRLVYLESPSRLTGAAYDFNAVREIANLLNQADAAALWDQGLAPWVKPDHYLSLTDMPILNERAAVLGELWPGVGLESWFLGYIGAPEPWFDRLRSQKQIMAICTSTPSQYAGLAAGDVFAQTHPDTQRRLADLRDGAVHSLRHTGAQAIRGDAATVLALRVPDAAATLARLRAAGFDAADGADFGAPGVVRLAITPDFAAERAVAALA